MLNNIGLPGIMVVVFALGGPSAPFGYGIISAQFGLSYALSARP